MMLSGKRKCQALSLAAKLEIISKLEIYLSYGQIPLTGTLRSQDARLREVRVYMYRSTKFFFAISRTRYLVAGDISKVKDTITVINFGDSVHVLLLT